MNDSRPQLFAMLPPLHSTATSGEGVSAAASRQKTIPAVDTATFLLK